MTTSRTVLTRLATAAVAALAFAATSARALSNAEFDARFNAQLGAMQRQNANAQQQLWQDFMRGNGPRLQREYAQMVASGNRSMSFQQYAYWDLMTARGTNVQGALQHQQNQFAGQQRAHATVMEGHASYNAGWAQNSQHQTAAVENWSNQSIRGVGPYTDGNGRTTMLPHSLPAGQVYRDGNNTYAQDQQGTYYRLENNAWVRMNAAR